MIYAFHRAVRVTQVPVISESVRRASSMVPQAQQCDQAGYLYGSLWKQKAMRIGPDSEHCARSLLDIRMTSPVLGDPRDSVGIAAAPAVCYSNVMEWSSAGRDKCKEKSNP